MLRKLFVIFTNLSLVLTLQHPNHHYHRQPRRAVSAARTNPNHRLSSSWTIVSRKSSVATGRRLKKRRGLLVATPLSSPALLGQSLPDDSIDGMLHASQVAEAVMIPQQGIPDGTAATLAAPIIAQDPTPDPLKEIISMASDNDGSLQFRSASSDLAQAAVVGVFTGLTVALFKLSIDAVRRLAYEQEFLVPFPYLIAAIPAFGGLLVGFLLLLGTVPAGLRGTVLEVEKGSRGPPMNWSERLRLQLSAMRKSAAAVATLGTGSSLGPEGPCVEIGMSVSRGVIDNPLLSIDPSRRLTWNRLLLACGAASGVAAGFDAPLAGVFFALEVVQGAFNSVCTRDLKDANFGNLLSTTSSITPILISSVLSALIAQVLLGDHLILRLTNYSLKSPLLELPLYLFLGAISGFVAFCFSRAAKLSKSLFAGELGDDRLQGLMRSIPDNVKPVIGGLFCGLVGLSFPQILFFGYETLNPLLAKNTLPTSLLLSLLIVKITTTAVSAGSGLVGGTFAPSLFLGAMTGAAFHNIMLFLLKAGSLQGLLPVWEIADVPAYAMVGAASVLAALFRAPLTASLLLFELTKDYEVILPLMASAGVGSLVGDILDDKLERAEEARRRRRDEDAVSWGDLSSQ